MKTEIKQSIAKLSAIAFLFALVVWVAPSSDAATDASRDVQINAEVLASLQLSVDAASVDIQVDPDVDSGQNWTAGSGVDATSQSVLTVSTNNDAGYNLSIELAGATATGSAVLDGSGTTTNTIPSFATATGSRTTENRFSYATGSGETTTRQFTSSTAVIPGAGLGNETNSNSDTIYYYLNVDHTTPADTYKGTVTYTAATL